MLDPSARVVLSTSGKGGVGKTLAAIGIATALSARHPVGLLDLDIRAPNLLPVLGLKPEKRYDPGYRQFPLTAKVDGRSFEVFSTTMVFGEGTAILSNGGTLQSLVKDMLRDVAWAEGTEWLVCDMDPSSGDALVAIAEAMRDVGAVIVVTSDVSSLSDAARMIDACRESGVAIRGILGNMIGAACAHCGQALNCYSCSEPVTYGERGPVQKLASDHGLRYLGDLPWNPRFKSDPVGMVQGQVASRIFDAVARACEGS